MYIRVCPYPPLPQTSVKLVKESFYIITLAMTVGQEPVEQTLRCVNKCMFVCVCQHQKPLVFQKDICGSVLGSFMVIK